MYRLKTLGSHLSLIKLNCLSISVLSQLIREFYCRVLLKDDPLNGHASRRCTNNNMFVIRQCNAGKNNKKCLSKLGKTILEKFPEKSPRTFNHLLHNSQ